MCSPSVFSTCHNAGRTGTKPVASARLRAAELEAKQVSVHACDLLLRYHLGDRGQRLYLQLHQLRYGNLVTHRHRATAADFWLVFLC